MSPMEKVIDSLFSRGVASSRRYGDVWRKPKLGGHRSSQHPGDIGAF
jgi:hypothetical protein